MAEFFDVVIAGGGPAGSTAGTLLAKHGWNVAIFEKEKFPRREAKNSYRRSGGDCGFSCAGVSAKAIRDDRTPNEP